MKIFFVFTLGILSSATQATELSFQQAMTQILNRDTQLASQRAQIDADDVSFKAAIFSFLPDLSLNAARSKSQLTDITTKTLSGNLSWNLWNSGRDWFQLHSRRYSLRASEEQLSLLTLEKEAEAGQLLFSNILLKRQIDIDSELVRIRQEILKVTQSRFSRGLAPRSDILKAQVDLANAEADLDNQKINWQEAQANLKQALGHTEVLYDWPWKIFFQTQAASDLLKRSFNLSQRPDFQNSYSILKAEKHKSYQRLAHFFPYLDFSLSRRRNQAGGEAYWETLSTLTLTIPLFDGLSDYAQWAQQKSRKTRAQQNLIQIERRAKAQYQRGQKHYQLALKTALQRQKTLELSRKLYRVNFQRFQQGRVSFNELTVDQERLFRSKRLATQGWQNVHIHFLSLCHTLGQNLQRCLNLTW